MIRAFSRDSEQCRKCSYYKNCDEKRMELCAYIVPEPKLQPLVEQYIMPNAVSLTDCINSLINETVTRQKIEEELEKELRRQLYCEF